MRTINWLIFWCVREVNGVSRVLSIVGARLEKQIKHRIFRPWAYTSSGVILFCECSKTLNLHLGLQIWMWNSCIFIHLNSFRFDRTTKGASFLPRLLVFLPLISSTRNWTAQTRSLSIYGTPSMVRTTDFKLTGSLVDQVKWRARRLLRRRNHCRRQRQLSTHSSHNKRRRYRVSSKYSISHLPGSDK